jgi:hypothetical protein
MELRVLQSSSVLLEYLQEFYIFIFRHFRKLRQATISFVMSVRPSFCPHGTTRLLLDVFSWNFIFGCFSKNYRDNPFHSIICFIQFGEEKRVLYMNATRHLRPYLSNFFLEWEIFRTKFVEKFETHILCSVTFFLKFCPLWDNVEKYCRDGETTVGNMAHPHFMLDN